MGRTISKQNFRLTCRYNIEISLLLFKPLTSDPEADIIFHRIMLTAFVSGNIIQSMVSTLAYGTPRSTLTSDPENNMSIEPRMFSVQ